MISKSISFQTYQRRQFHRVRIVLYIILYMSFLTLYIIDLIDLESRKKTYRILQTSILYHYSQDKYDIKYQVQRNLFHFSQPVILMRPEFKNSKSWHFTLIRVFLKIPQKQNLDLHGLNNVPPTGSTETRYASDTLLLMIIW